MTNLPSTQISMRFVSLLLLIPSPASTWAIGGASYPPSRWRHSGQKRVLALRQLVVVEISARRRSCQSFPREGKSPFLPPRDENIHTHPQDFSSFVAAEYRVFFLVGGEAWSERFPAGPPKKTTMAARFAKGISLTSLLCLCCCVLAERKGMWRSHTDMERYGTVSCWVAPFFLIHPSYYCASVFWLLFFLNRDLTEITART